VKQTGFLAALAATSAGPVNKALARKSCTIRRYNCHHVVFTMLDSGGNVIKRSPVA
jgi:hypothetical protein